MFSEKNLPRLIVLSPILAIILITFITSYVFIASQHKTFEDESKDMEKNFLHVKKTLLKERILNLNKYLTHQESIYMDNANEKVIKRVHVLEELLLKFYNNIDKRRDKREVLRNVINSRTSASNYFFAYDVKKELIYQPIGRDIRDEFYEDEKFFDNYLFYEAGKLVTFHKSNKIVYMLYIPKLNWIVGNIENISKDINFIKRVSKNYITSVEFDKSGRLWILENQKQIINEKEDVIKALHVETIQDTEEGISTEYKSDGLSRLAYTIYFEPWDWVVGASLNLDDIQNTITKEKEKLNQRAQKYIWTTVYISLVVMIIVTFLSIMLSNKISNIFKLYKQNDAIQKDKLIALNQDLKLKIAKRVKEVQLKDRAMFHQSRLARLGTMISMIAHQWRQPLTEVSAILAEIETAAQFGKVDNEMIKENLKESDKLITYMSNTIDDFRMYFKPNKKKENFSLQKVCNDAISLMSGTYKELGIELNKNFDADIELNGYPREFAQVILNLLMNSKDILLEREIKEKKVEFFVTNRGKKVYVIIRDNAGGIKVENLDKVFEPYFSTKDTNKASGLGLFMSKMIVEKNMNGKLYVFNRYDGVQFNIEL